MQHYAGFHPDHLERQIIFPAAKLCRGQHRSPDPRIVKTCPAVGQLLF